MKYIVTRVVSQEVEVEASSYEEAFEKAKTLEASAFVETSSHLSECEEVSE